MNIRFIKFRSLIYLRAKFRGKIQPQAEGHPLDKPIPQRQLIREMDKGLKGLILAIPASFHNWGDLPIGTKLGVYLMEALAVVMLTAWITRPFRRRFKARMEQLRLLKGIEIKQPQFKKEVDLKKDLLPWRTIESDFQNMTWNMLQEQKYYRGKIGDTDIEGKIRNLQKKYWENTTHWKLHKEDLKDLIPGQVQSYYSPSPDASTQYENKPDPAFFEVG